MEPRGVFDAFLNGLAAHRGDLKTDGYQIESESQILARWIGNSVELFPPPETKRSRHRAARLKRFLEKHGVKLL